MRHCKRLKPEPTDMPSQRNLYRQQVAEFRDIVIAALCTDLTYEEFQAAKARAALTGVCWLVPRHRRDRSRPASARARDTWEA